MKNYVYIVVAALCVMLGCSQEEMTENRPVSKVGIQASFEQGNSQSRLAVGEKNVLTWSKGDAFLIFDDSKSYRWELEGNGGESTGTFIGEIPANKLIGAGYPADKFMKVVNGKLTMKLNEKIKYDENRTCNLPMWGKMTSLEDGITFNHLGALLKIDLQNIPEGFHTMTVKADKPLTGTFEADFSGYENDPNFRPVLVASPEAGESGTLTITGFGVEEGSKNCMFYVPLPAINYASIEVFVSNNEKQLSLAKWSDKNIQRANVYKASVAFKETSTTEPGGVTSELNGLGAELPSVQVTMTSKIEAEQDEAIEIPVIDEVKTYVQLEFQQVPNTENAALVIQEKNTGSSGGSTDKTNELSISIPATESTMQMEINTPTTTVNVESGKFGTLTATTAQNTLVLGQNVQVENLIIKGGNIRINSGNIIKSIKKDTKEEILLIIQTGVTEYSLPKSLPEGVRIVRSIDNKELSAALAAEFQNQEDIDYELDGNGYLLMTESEMEKVTSLHIGWKDYHIPSLKGLEYFVNLESFSCGASGVTICDFSKNKSLRDLSVDFNNIKYLDLSQNPDLTVVNCSWNENLQTLKLANDVKLDNLSVEHTALTSLIVPNPGTVDMLTFGYTGLASMDLSGFENLVSLNMGGLKLQNLKNIPKNIKGNLEYLGCRENELTSLDLSEYTALKDLRCEYNYLTELDLSGNKEIQNLDCMANKIEDLDISKTQLGDGSTMFCGKQQDGIILNLTLTDEQKEVWHNHWKNSHENTFVNLVGEEPVEMITFENESFAQELKYQFGDNVILQDGKAILEKGFVEKQTELVFWGAEGLTSLEGIQNFVNLEKLVCVYHKITSLDVSGMTKLKVLECWDGKLASLDVSGCTSLKELYLQKNALVSLDVSDCTGITNLNCEDNKLTSLDLKACVNEKIELYCGNQGYSAGEEITLTLKLTDAMKVYWKQYLFDIENNEVRVLIDGDSNQVVAPSIGKENW